MRKSYSRPVTLLKRDSTQVFSSELSEIFKNNYFEKDLRTTASENLTSGSSFFCVTCNSNSRRSFYSTTNTRVYFEFMTNGYLITENCSFCSIKFHRWNEGTSQTLKFASSYKFVLLTLRRRVKLIQFDKAAFRNYLQENRKLALLLCFHWL